MTEWFKLMKKKTVLLHVKIKEIKEKMDHSNRIPGTI